MRLVAGLIVAIIFIAISSRSIRKMAPLYYLIALALDVAFIYSTSAGVPPWFRTYILFIFQSNTLAMGLFTVVMFTGALRDGSYLRKYLMPIRAELSIIASILCIGHMVVYGRSYFDQIISSTLAMPTARLIATIIALLLALLLIPLAISSFKTVKARMQPKSWKRIQRFAYLFFLLIFIHIFFYLLPPALAGSSGAIFSLMLYTILCVLYLILRIRLILSRKVDSQPDYSLQV